MGSEDYFLKVTRVIPSYLLTLCSKEKEALSAILLKQSA